MFSVKAKLAVAFFATLSLTASDLYAQQVETSDALALAQHKFERAIAPIKSATEFSKYMEVHTASDNPLNLLSRPALQRFKSSLVFSDAGLTTYSYVDVEAELTLSQTYFLLSLFGLQNLITDFQNSRVVTDADSRIAAARIYLPAGAGLKNYSCFATGTCIRDSGKECPIDDCKTGLPQ